MGAALEPKVYNTPLTVQVKLFPAAHSACGTYLLAANGPSTIPEDASRSDTLSPRMMRRYGDDRIFIVGDDDDGDGDDDDDDDDDDHTTFRATNSEAAKEIEAAQIAQVASVLHMIYAG